ncbi:hypothetical protein [Mycolicibacterium gilvum]|uniref:hypothetical protein n=1 Tax=Mycolicibacterium gilvum TaxID=1804 RepID=UPI0040453F57
MFLISADQLAAHERITGALARVRTAAALRRPVHEDDLTSALGSCGCPECRSNLRHVTWLLRRLGLIA